jgi:hypothetical protein
VGWCQANDTSCQAGSGKVKNTARRKKDVVERAKAKAENL